MGWKVERFCKDENLLLFPASLRHDSRRWGFSFNLLALGVFCFCLITESTKGGDKSGLFSLFVTDTKPGVEHRENAPESQSETVGDEERQLGCVEMLGGGAGVIFVMWFWGYLKKCESSTLYTIIKCY
jgi:hypothetical protein